MSAIYGVLGDCGACGTRPQVWCEYLDQTKQWPGIKPFKREAWDAVFSAPGDFRALTEGEQREARMRFGTKITHQDIRHFSPDNQTYNWVWGCEDKLVGPGHSLTSSPGVPVAFDSWTGQPLRFSPIYNAGWSNTGGWAEDRSLTHRTLTSHAWWPVKGWQTTEELKDEVPLAPLLTKAVNRLNARSWSEVVDVFDPFAKEVFHEPPIGTYPWGKYMDLPAGEFTGDPSPPYHRVEWPTGGHTDVPDGEFPWGPGHNDGTPSRIASPAVQLYPAAFGAVFACWYCFQVPGSVDIGTCISARRTRWRSANRAVSYFTARTLLYYDYRWETDGGDHLVRELKVHNVARLTSEGVAAQNDYVEIPCPYGEGEGFNDFVMLNGMLSAGAVAFAIIGESKASWKARTGMKLVGTADDLVTTTDQDTTVDQDD